MTVYKVCPDDDLNFNIYTYDFWSYVLSVKLKKGRLFFNKQKAEALADECNALAAEAREISEKRIAELKRAFCGEEVED